MVSIESAALGTYIESLAPHIRVTFGHSETGNPTMISGQEFTVEFGYSPGMSIRERLRQARFQGIPESSP